MIALPRDGFRIEFGESFKIAERLLFLKTIKYALKEEIEKATKEETDKCRFIINAWLIKLLTVQKLVYPPRTTEIIAE